MWWPGFWKLCIEDMRGVIRWREKQLCTLHGFWDLGSPQSRHNPALFSPSLQPNFIDIKHISHFVAVSIGHIEISKLLLGPYGYWASWNIHFFSGLWGAAERSEFRILIWREAISGDLWFVEENESYWRDSVWRMGHIEDAAESLRTYPEPHRPSWGYCCYERKCREKHIFKEVFKKWHKELLSYLTFCGWNIEKHVSFGIWRGVCENSLL